MITGKIINFFFVSLLFVVLVNCMSCNLYKNKDKDKPSISGIYPHLANYNNEGECGTGAVVPWADRLWVITYGPHLPFGSSDKLYEITPDLEQIVRSESIGGTPANRMIHKESNQLFIGPYAIDDQQNVRVISYQNMPGRHTGNARHLLDPAGKIYYGTMEEGFYEVEVNSLKPNLLYEDGNVNLKVGEMVQKSALLAGAHGKGLYSGQGVLVYSNNGETGEAALKQFDIEAGGLFEWDGTEWKLIRRCQFVEVTGPGGIYGNPNPDTDPIWVTGWDHKSLLLGVRDAKKGWTFYRLPKASHSYDGAHGWNTEWPRIRDIGTKTQPGYLMTMHGMFWSFPRTFTAENSAGIRPRSAYLKVIGDFTKWDDRLVFGCDDSAQKEFLNKRKAKGNIEGPGQSNSNLWFTPISTPDELGPSTAGGTVWAGEKINADDYSEPFLFNGWPHRSSWVKNEGTIPVTITYEVDKKGNNDWSTLKSITLAAGESAHVDFSPSETGEWVRAKPNKPTTLTLTFTYGDNDTRNTTPDAIFKGLAGVRSGFNLGGLLYGLGDNRRALGLLANVTTDGNTTETGYYEMGEELKLEKKEDVTTADFIREQFAIPHHVVRMEKGSVLIVDDKERRWRLPLGEDVYSSLTDSGLLRICREVVTERDLFSCHGTFYELPAENADGYAKIRPVATHRYRINDYTSYRGMLVLTGITPAEGKGNPHIIVSKDGKAAVWAGVIDDLWKLGKPTGKGGPWVESDVKSKVASDPYLIGFYDQRQLTLSHKSEKTVKITVEVDPTGNGDWMKYAVFKVEPKQQLPHQFSSSFHARWIRFTSDNDANVTAWLEYK